MKNKALAAVDLFVVAVMIVGILPLVMVVFPIEWLLDTVRNPPAKSQN